jgi:hypothetical protein
MMHVEAPISDRAAARSVAVLRAREVCLALDKLGVTVRVIGSLTTDRFGPRSDIDFLVVDCPRHLKYAIEGTIEDCLDGFPFDVVYLDEVPKHKLDRLVKGAVDARHLR